MPAVLFAFVLLGHRLIYGPQEEGALWTVSSVEFFLFGLIFLALGLIGEYVGRIYLEVRRRPTYIVRKVHGAELQRAIRDPTANRTIRKLISEQSWSRWKLRDACCSRTTRWATRAWRRCSRWARR